MRGRKLQKMVFVLVVIGLFVPGFWKKAMGVPSFARQTGMTCTACHTMFPELKTFGRTFKLNGYVYSKRDELYEFPPPLTAMAQVSYTHTTKKQPSDSVDEHWSSHFLSSGNDNVNAPQQASGFYGGKVFYKLGALVQGTYDGAEDDVFLDNTDIRFADTISLGGKKLTLGLTVNNNPTVEDVWNSTPAWGFPYASSAVAPTPSAGTIIDGALGQQVGGLGVYAFWNHLIYAEVAGYRTTRSGVTEFLGGGTPTDTVVDDVFPYWRVALQHEWGQHALSVGTYGTIVDVFPGVTSHGPTDRFTDIAVDAQYQYVGRKFIVTAQTTLIHEEQDWDASFPLGMTSNSSDTLDTFRINVNLYYLSHSFGKIGGTAGYFSTTGSDDALLYPPGPIDGSRTGSPDSNGFILQLTWLPFGGYRQFLSPRLSLQYVIYDKFNGSSSNYDGSGRDASDNNTFYALLWLMF
jgi:hypothetical protein